MKRRTLIGTALVLPLVAACQSKLGDENGGSDTGGTSTESPAPRNSEALSDERVRKAIAHAIDMNGIIASLYKGKAKPANALMPAGPNKPDTGLVDYPYNPERAKALLKEAGWDNNRELDLVYYYGDQVTVDFLAAVQQFLAQVGIKVKPRKLEGDLASQLWVAPKDPVKGPSAVKWDLAYAAVGALSPYDYYNRLVGGYSGNSYWPDNPEFTKLIQATAASPDPKVQSEAFQKVVKWDNAHLPAVPLYYQPVFAVQSDKLDRKGAEYGNEQYNYDWQINKWDLPAGADGKKVLRSNGGPVQFFEHPFFNPGYLMSQRILWDHLIVAAGDMTPKAGQLAESYELAPDGKKLTFKLRNNIKWHDGAPITGEDVKFTFEFARKVGSLHSTFASTLKKMSDIKVDGNTIEFTFSELDPGVLTTFSQLPPLPKKHLEGADPLRVQQAPYFQNPVGSGPFRLSEVKMGNYAVAQAWDGYWGGKPVIDEIRLYPSGESDSNLVKNVQAGQVDYAYTKSVDDAAAVEKVAGMQVHSVDVYYTRMFWVNSFPRG